MRSKLKFFCHLRAPNHRIRNFDPRQENSEESVVRTEKCEKMGSKLEKLKLSEMVKVRSKQIATIHDLIYSLGAFKKFVDTFWSCSDLSLTISGNFTFSSFDLVFAVLR